MRLKLLIALVVLVVATYWILSHSFLIVSTMTALAALALVVVVLWLAFGGHRG